MSLGCAPAQPATPTTGTSRLQKAWNGLQTVVAHFLNSADPACDADILGFAFLLPISIYWMHTRPVINSQWAACFATIWAAVGLKAFARRGGDR